uniref:Uncharacterized protein n=1 Tax=Lactuca sativa TaxID=4236 RepID=A0A9R1X1J7_LACSA|nr:hypothetical protein LSAT_V11C700355190 [Lactuca sativa]
MVGVVHVFNDLFHQLNDIEVMRLCTVFDKIEGHLNPIEPRVNSRYTHIVHGFVYTFKIWIMETFLNNSIDGSPILGVIPQAISYPSMMCLHVIDCERILDVEHTLNGTKIL